MGLFKSFEEKAKKKYGEFTEEKESVDNGHIIPKDKQNNTENYERLIDDLGAEEKDNFNDNIGGFDDSFNLQPSQKPESFHFFILDNQYQDLERMIRGVKDVWDKEAKEWKIKRKDIHCFTDEEAEDIIRTAQSHLSPDIKLAIFHKEEYPILLNSIYFQLNTLFRSIMEYRYGRYKDETQQYKMKQQAVNIFQALTMRIKANYSRAIMGSENKATHQSVKGQESLQGHNLRALDENSYT